MKINKLMLAGLAIQSLSFAAVANDNIRWGRSQTGGNLVHNNDLVSVRNSSIMDCKSHDRGRYGQGDTQRLTKSFCIYMSNKDKLENIWIDLDISEEKIGTTQQYIYVERSKKEKIQRQLEKVAKDVSHLEYAIPVKVKAKIAKETKFNSMDSVINRTQKEIQNKQRDLKSAQGALAQADSKRASYYNSTYSTPEKRHTNAVNIQNAKLREIQQTTGSISLKKRAIVSIGSQIAAATRYKGSLYKAQYEFKKEMKDEVTEEIETKSLKNTYGRAQATKHATIMLEEARKGTTNSISYRNARSILVFKNTTINGKRVLGFNIDDKNIRRYEKAMWKLVNAEKHVANLKTQKVTAEKAIVDLGKKKSKQETELKPLKKKVAEAYSVLAPLKSSYDKLLKVVSGAKANVNSISGSKNSLEARKRSEIQKKAQLKVDVNVLAGEIKAKQNLIVQKKIEKENQKKRLADVAGHVSALQTKLTKIESGIRSLKQEQKEVIRTIKDNAVVETYDRNLGVAATHIFVGAFPYALGNSGLSYNQGSDDSYRGRNRFGRSDFRNARHGQRIKDVYSRAVRNGERVFLWGNFNNSELVDELSSETGVHAVYYPRRTRRNLVEMKVVTKSAQDFRLRSQAEHRLTFLDIDSTVAVPVIFASKITRGYVGEEEVVMSATTKPSGAVVFTSGLCITDFTTRNLEIILDKVNSANIKDFAIESTAVEPITTPDVGPIVDSFSGEKTVTVNSGKTLNDSSDASASIEELISMDIPAGNIVSEVELTVKMQYSYVGDVSLTLVSPSGVIIPLRSRTGGSARDINATYKVSVASSMLEVKDNLDTRSAVSSVRLEAGVLSSQNAGGVWKVIIKDDAVGHGDQGTVESLTLRVVAN